MNADRGTSGNAKDRPPGGGPPKSCVAAVVLAAGQSRRFAAVEDGTKVVARLDGLPLVRRVANAGLSSRACPVIVVTGHAAAAVGDALSGLTVQTVVNPDYRSGMASSLRLALATIPARAQAALVLLADMPLVTVETIDRLIACFETDPEAIDAVVPVFEGRQGNPVLIGRRLFNAFDALVGDEGARRLLADPGRMVVFCPVEDRGVAIDVDTRASLRKLQRNSAGL